MDKDANEAQVVAEVKSVLIEAGLMKRKETDPGAPSQVQRINTGNFSGGDGRVKSANKGTLDFEGYDNHGRMLGIECKRPKGGRLSPEQKARIDDINAKGGVAGMVRSGAEAAELLIKNDCLNYGAGTGQTGSLPATSLTRFDSWQHQTGKPE